MWFIIKDVLINVLIILFPILIYFVFFRENRSERKRIPSKFNVTLFFTLMLCMTFQASYSTDFSYDLRLIPIIVAFIYGGVSPALVLVGSTLLLAAAIEPSDFFSNLGNYLIASIILFKLRNPYHEQSIHIKVLLISLFYLLVASTRIIYFLQINQLEQLPFLISYSMIVWVTLLSVIFLIENMEKQQSMQRELEQFEKMNAVSQLAAGVAHEIRNPMTTVRGFLQILNNSQSIPSKDKSFITISIGELDRAQKIINEYLALSKPPKNIFEEINLTNVLNDAVSIISSYAVMNNVEIVSSIEDSLMITGYKHQIQQVVINLLKNGIEAMENGGTMEIYASKNSGNIEVTIKDEGLGISKAELKRLGTPYYSTKEKGTGLGLTVSFEIIKKMNGRIEVKSVVDEGTVFTIILPAE